MANIDKININGTTHDIYALTANTTLSSYYTSYLKNNPNLNVYFIDGYSGTIPNWIYGDPLDYYKWVAFNLSSNHTTNVKPYMLKTENNLDLVRIDVLQDQKEVNVFSEYYTNLITNGTIQSQKINSKISFEYNYYGTLGSNLLKNTNTNGAYIYQLRLPVKYLIHEDYTNSDGTAKTSKFSSDNIFIPSVPVVPDYFNHTAYDYWIMKNLNSNGSNYPFGSKKMVCSNYNDILNTNSYTSLDTNIHDVEDIGKWVFNKGFDTSLGCGASMRIYGEPFWNYFKKLICSNKLGSKTKYSENLGVFSYPGFCPCLYKIPTFYLMNLDQNITTQNILNIWKNAKLTSKPKNMTDQTWSERTYICCSKMQAEYADKFQNPNLCKASILGGYTSWDGCTNYIDDYKPDGTVGDGVDSVTLHLTILYQDPTSVYVNLGFNKALYTKDEADEWMEELCSNLEYGYENKLESPVDGIRFWYRNTEEYVAEGGSQSSYVLPIFKYKKALNKISTITNTSETKSFWLSQFVYCHRTDPFIENIYKMSYRYIGDTNPLENLYIPKNTINTVNASIYIKGLNDNGKSNLNNIHLYWTDPFALTAKKPPFKYNANYPLTAVSGILDVPPEGMSNIYYGNFGNVAVSLDGNTLSSTVLENLPWTVKFLCEID